MSLVHFAPLPRDFEHLARALRTWPDPGLGRARDARTLADVIGGADVFLGLSAGGVLKPEMVKAMADKPLILALANPTPEILPEEVMKVRQDAVMATGRTDYPNQVNNVLCFPYIFRGALDAGASTITTEMEIAAVHAIAELAQAEQNEVVAAAYAGEQLTFGPDYLIPKPFDPRVLLWVAPAVARAAMKSGVKRIGCLPKLAHFLAKKANNSGTSSLRSRKGGVTMGNTFKR